MERHVVSSLEDNDKMAEQRFQANILLYSNGNHQELFKGFSSFYKECLSCKNDNKPILDIPVYSNFNSKSKWNSFFRGKAKKVKGDPKETHISSLNEYDDMCYKNQNIVTKNVTYMESKFVGSQISCFDKSTKTFSRADFNRTTICSPYNLALHKTNDDDSDETRNLSKEPKSFQNHQNYKNKNGGDIKESTNNSADNEKLYQVITTEVTTDSVQDSEQIETEGQTDKTLNSQVITSPKFQRNVNSISPKMRSRECDEDCVINKIIDRIPHGHYTHSKYHGNCGFQDDAMYKLYAPNIEHNNIFNNTVRKKINYLNKYHVCRRILPNTNKIILPKRVLTSDNIY